MSDSPKAALAAEMETNSTEKDATANIATDKDAITNTTNAGTDKDVTGKTNTTTDTDAAANTKTITDTDAAANTNTTTDTDAAANTKTTTDTDAAANTKTTTDKNATVTTNATNKTVTGKTAHTTNKNANANTATSKTPNIKTTTINNNNAPAKPKSKPKPRPKSKTSSPAPMPPPPKKSPSPSPSKSSKGPPRAGANRDSLRLPRLRSTSSLGPGSAPNTARSRSAASSPSASHKRPVGSVTPRFPSSNIPIPVPDYPKSERARMRNAASESNAVVNGHSYPLSHNEGVFSPGLVYTSRRRPEFVIHPEWISEAVGADKLPPLPHPFRTKQMHGDSATSAVSTSALWPKRCKSAPPPNYRNPITWE